MDKPPLATLTIIVVFEEFPDVEDLKAEVIENLRGIGRVTRADLEITQPTTLDLR